MSRRNHFSVIRTVLVLCLLGMSVNGCASDGRLDLKNLSKMQFKQPGWLQWDRDKPPARAPASAAPQQSAAAPSAAPPAKAVPLSQAAAPARTADTGRTSDAPMLRSNLPRPKPWRSLSRTAASTPIPRKSPVMETKEQPASAPQGKVTSETPQALAVLPSPAKAPRAQGKGGYSPADLIGLDAPAVERLLGKPDLSRKEPFAEVWQYTHGDCVLFVFIYAQDGGEARVSHAETGARDGGKTPEPGQCIGAILSRNAASPG